MNNCIFCKEKISDTFRCPKCSNIVVPAPEGMTYIPSGKFLMGENRLRGALPEKEVFIPGFFIDIYPVTNKEYREFEKDYSFKRGEEEHPAISICWYDAQEYAKSKGKRLPTEAEWEKAARGEGDRKYPWGNEFNRSLCNFKKWGILKKTTPVKEFPKGASPYGCFDMAGNVWEWTSTEYDGDGRVLKGGAWSSPSIKFLHVSSRLKGLPRAMLNFGLRCAKG